MQETTHLVVRAMFLSLEALALDCCKFLACCNESCMTPTMLVSGSSSISAYLVSFTTSLGSSLNRGVVIFSFIVIP